MKKTELKKETSVVSAFATLLILLFLLFGFFAGLIIVFVWAINHF